MTGSEKRTEQPVATESPRLTRHTDPTKIRLTRLNCLSYGRRGGPDSEDSPYVGVFTGEYVDGKPLYRFPSILVVGSRSGADGL